jgi:hypothetical protein
MMIFPHKNIEFVLFLETRFQVLYHAVASVFELYLFCANQLP